jgi:hypothetical protein
LRERGRSVHLEADRRGGPELSARMEEFLTGVEFCRQR